MNAIQQLIEQARLAFVQHAPVDMLREAVPFGIVCLMVGVALSVLGAKLARVAIGVGFALLGGYVGAYFAQQLEFSRLICGLGGALMIGIIGYQTYRLWVGVAAAAVLSSFALGLFGYKELLPHMAAFDEASVATTSAVVSTKPFAVPTPQQQEGYRNRTVTDWAREFWAFAKEKDIRIERTGKALALAALVTGLCLGVLAVRTALILSTSLMGTAMVATGVATLLTHSIPDTYHAFASNPGLVGVGVGGFLTTSLVLQTMLTRNAPAAKPDSRPKH